jgi:hypothetical protein
MNLPVSLFDSFEINEQLLPATNDGEEKFRAFRLLLIRRLDELIHHDFEKLKWILYRIDVSEKKLNEALMNSEQDAATVMADMIIKRQIEKAESRKKHSEGEADWSFEI